MSPIRRVALYALILLVPQIALPCHVPETLRAMQGELTPAQLALLSHGHPGEQIPYELAAATTCTNGFADIFPCENVDLLAHMNLSEIGGGAGNDMWGWEDPVDGTEYAIIGRSNGTSFVDVSDPENPVYLGNLPTHTGSSTWRDIKVYQDHAYVVSDSNGSHGLQVFDLTQLRTVVNPPVTFAETAHYDNFGSAHNVAINEDSGFAYVVGSSSCSAGLHIVDLNNPAAPSFAGCYSSDGYTHDVQCVNYSGPDPDHQGKEICFASNEDTVTIVDVTVKGAPVQLSRTGYSNHGYVHQGWLTADQAYFIHDDELDELFFGLDNPTLGGFHEHDGGNIDHNQYVTGGHAYQSNYTQGLRIMEVTDPASATLTQVGYFDTFPENDGSGFSGSWSNYPFFDSGIVLISDTSRGLFIVRPNLGGGSGIPCGDFDRFQARCQPNGRVQYRVIMNDGTHNGESVTFQVDGSIDDTSTINNGRATGQQSGLSLGAHTIELVDPAGCFQERVVTCQ
jgi:choice-of-anchor B domain-containing protein